jgi:hypothetical protein
LDTLKNLAGVDRSKIVGYALASFMEANPGVAKQVVLLRKKGD